jgi:UPF0176 protein
MKKYRVLLYYKYVQVDDPVSFMKEHQIFCDKNEIKGRVFISSEGINGTVSGSVENIEKYKSDIRSRPYFADIVFKEDEENDHVFKKMHVRVKDQIVNSDMKKISPRSGGKRLSPEELLKFYKEGKDFVIIDARNWYESKIGKFKNAVTPPLANFREWNKAVDDLKDLKDKTVVTYCTGGVRCEKASAYMVEQGFKDVYQLEGGIVSFTKKFPDTYWEGGIFVFDERRVVEPNSIPELKYISDCFFCGKPTSYYINCHNLDCDKILVSCHDCKTTHDYCCSDECRRSENRRKKYYG